VETFRGLTWNSSNDPDLRRRHYATVINARSRLVYVQPPWAGLDALPAAEDNPTLGNMPMTPLAALATLTGGADETAAPTDTQVVGVDLGPGNRSGICSLQDVEDVRIVAAPGYTGTTIQNALISQCELMRYRFAVLDGELEPAGASVVTSILAHRNAYDTSFAAYYTPWVEVGAGDQRLLLPPSGHVAGIYARTDSERGVHKAPANEVVRGITGLRSYLTTGEQDILNPRGVNAIRRFEGRGIRVWGARTLSSDPEFRYVNVRRFLIFLEASIDRGTQYVVFEPNAPETWGRIVDSVSAFLHTQWRSGALFGRRPEDAFFVRCDETTMTADDIQNGRLICTVGVAIVRPAEFVIFRIEQITGFAGQT
jgi:phage tail sheath protein FI